MLKSIGLIRFLKGDHDNNVPGCANYDNQCGGCLLDNECKVETGKRCEYFEKAVLPAATGIGLGSTIRDIYADRVGLVGFRPRMNKDARHCVCGEVLRPRQRCCDKCATARQKQAYRENQRKKRLSKLQGVLS